MALAADTIPALTVASPKTASRYLAVWAATLLATSCALAGFTAAVDPYALTNAPRIQGFNALKYEMREFGRAAKLREVARRKPQAIILGNSQAEGGLSSATLARLTGQSAYNLSFLGAPIEETEVVFRFALDAAPVRTAVLALDLVAFDGDRHGRVGVMRERASGNLLRAARDFAELTMSIRAFTTAVRAMLSNRVDRPPSHDADGNWSVHDDIPIDDNAAPVAMKTPAESAYRAFDAICRLAAERGIDLRMIATPVHKAFGTNPAMRAQWFARLQEIAARHGFSVADENGDAAFRADKANFFDRGHFRAAVGDAMLERLFAKSAPPASEAQR